MNSKETKAAIADSFIDLLGDNPHGKITVSEIAEHCGISVPTFYNHFKNKDDLIKWIYIQRSHAIASRIGKDGFLWRDAMREWIVYLRSDSLFVMNALSNVNGSSALIGAMEEITIEFTTSEVAKGMEGEPLSTEQEDLVRIYCYGLCSFLYTWLTDPEPKSVDEVCVLAEKSLPYPLRYYLMG